jgi:hypothetical protein
LAPDAIFVDDGNIGGAIIDRLRQLAPDLLVIAVQFGGKGRDAEILPGVTMRTANKRAEIWTTMRAWLSNGTIPDQQRLKDDLVGPEYGYRPDQSIILESKDDMKKRGLPSPDWADALACTFAEPVEPRAMIEAVTPATMTVIVRVVGCAPITIHTHDAWTFHHSQDVR